MIAIGTKIGFAGFVPILCLLQTRKSVYVVESKRENELGEEVECEVPE